MIIDKNDIFGIDGFYFNENSDVLRICLRLMNRKTINVDITPSGSIFCLGPDIVL